MPVLVRCGGSGTPLAKATPWTEAESLANEKEVLGFYISSHPLDTWKSWYSVFATANTATAKDMPQDTRVILPGLVQSLRQLVVKTGRSAGQKMAIVTFEDTFGAVEAVVFTDAFASMPTCSTPIAQVSSSFWADWTARGVTPKSSSNASSRSTACRCYRAGCN